MAHPKLNITTLDFYSAEPGKFIVDCASALSRYNRRSYRSGYVYSIDYIEFIANQQESIAISILPTTYGLLGAYRLGFETWKQQRADAIEDTGIEPGKWSDFKPWYSEEHLTAIPPGGWPELEPRGMGLGLVLQALDDTGSEWNRAEIVVNDPAAATTSTINVGMLGDDNLPYGSLMHAYGVTRVATLSPDPVLPVFASGSWITHSGEESADMSEDVVNLIEDENDQPPYANQADNTLPPTYVGNGHSAPRGILLDQGVTGATGRPINLNGGLVPLGLLAIDTDAATGFTIRVHMTRGDYKGVAAKSMGSFR